MKLLIAFTLLLSQLSLAEAASFDCALAKTAMERGICNNPDLSHLDDRLAVAYRTSLEKAGDPHVLRSAQRAWLSATRRCTDDECLREAYESRIKALTLASDLSGRATGGVVDNSAVVPRESSGTVVQQQPAVQSPSAPTQVPLPIQKSELSNTVTVSSGMQSDSVVDHQKRGATALSALTAALESTPAPSAPSLVKQMLVTFLLVIAGIFIINKVPSTVVKTILMSLMILMLVMGTFAYTHNTRFSDLAIARENLRDSHRAAQGVSKEFERFAQMPSDEAGLARYNAAVSKMNRAVSDIGQGAATVAQLEEERAARLQKREAGSTGQAANSSVSSTDMYNYALGISYLGGTCERYGARMVGLSATRQDQAMIEPYNAARAYGCTPPSWYKPPQ